MVQLGGRSVEDLGMRSQTGVGDWDGSIGEMDGGWLGAGLRREVWICKWLAMAGEGLVVVGETTSHGAVRQDG